MGAKAPTPAHFVLAIGLAALQLLVAAMPYKVNRDEGLVEASVVVLVQLASNVDELHLRISESKRCEDESRQAAAQWTGWGLSPGTPACCLLCFALLYLIHAPRTDVAKRRN